MALNRPATLLRLSIMMAAVLICVAPVVAQEQSPELVDRILVIVDEEVILQSDLEREVSLYYLEARNNERDIADDPQEIRQEVLDRLVESKLIIAAARLEEIEVSDESVEREVQGNIDQLVRYYGSRDALVQELGSNGMTLADYRKRSRSQLRDQHYMRAVLNRFIRPRIEVRQDEVDAWYRNHLDEVPTTPDSLSLADILIPVEPDDEVQREVQRKLGQALQMLGEGASFSAVAEAHSDGPMAARGGKIGNLKRGDLYSKALEDAVFSMTVGQTSSPIVSERGVHIMHVNAADADTRDVSQIFYPLEITEQDVDRARTKAEAIFGRLTAGEAFGAVAVNESADPVSSAKGGELGTFALNDLSPAVQDALRDLAPGGMTNPFLTPAGFYIFLVRDRAYGHKLTLEEVRPQVQQAVESEKIEAELKVYVADLRTRFVVDLKD